MHRRR